MLLFYVMYTVLPASNLSLTMSGIFVLKCQANAKNVCNMCPSVRVANRGHSFLKLRFTLCKAE